jgi:hypothetical protein
MPAGKRAAGDWIQEGSAEHRQPGLVRPDNIMREKKITMENGIKNTISSPADCNHGAMLDALMENLNVTSDAALSRKLMVPPPVISKLRNNKIGVSAGLLVRIHDVTGLSINSVRAMLGLPTPEPRDARTLKNVVYSPIAPLPVRKKRGRRSAA